MDHTPVTLVELAERGAVAGAGGRFTADSGASEQL
jgi:hypothetical protein